MNEGTSGAWVPRTPFEGGVQSRVGRRGLGGFGAQEDFELGTTTYLLANPAEGSFDRSVRQ